MPHNVDRKPIYPDRREPSKRKSRFDFKKIGKGVLQWSPLWIPITLFAWVVVDSFVDLHCLNHNGIRTTALVEKTYLSTGRGPSKMVKYYFYVGDSLYYGHTSPPDSVWNLLHPHVKFDIVYEKGNPNHSNWAGYIKDKNK